MDILSIDLGTYSVKFLELFVERRNVYLKHYLETPLSSIELPENEEITSNELQYEIIKSYLAERQFPGKVIINIPGEMTTSRYFTLPVDKVKKAELMIPYQLDENLPFSVTDAHYSSIVFKEGKSTKAIINITKADEFNDFYNELNHAEILPNILTSSLFAKHAYLNLPMSVGIINSIPEKHYMILDIGHHTTKGYLIDDKKLAANHTSSVAGSFINETIAEMYSIPEKEAVEYKHANCFFLNQSQYSEVNEDQAEFAKLMQQTMTPLIHDINQWLLGYRIKNINPIECIYLTGGTSKIKNIASFLSEELGIPVKKFQPFNFVRKQKLNIDEAKSMTAANSLIQGVIAASKIPNLNFLKGQYSPTSSETIPLYSTAFVAFRVMVVCFFLIFALLIQRVLVSGHNNKIHKNLNVILKKKSLNMKAAQRNQLKRNPGRLLKSVLKKENAIKQEVSTLMSALSINAINPLFKINSILTPEMNIYIQSFKNTAKGLKIIFIAEKFEKLKDLEKRLNKDPKFKTATIKFNKKLKSLTLSQTVDN